MWSVPPALPPPHEMLPGFALNFAIRSFVSLMGELAGTTMTSYSEVSRAIGVTWSRVTADLFWIVPPTITMPPIMSACGSPFEVLTNCASPMAPAAPPLLSYWMFFTAPAASIALPSSRPVVSQPPPGFAGIIIFTLSSAAAEPAIAMPAATAAVRISVRAELRAIFVLLVWNRVCPVGEAADGPPRDSPRV